MRVYLAGPINASTDEEVHGWRAKARAILEANGDVVINPAVRDYRGRELDTANVRDIVEGDKAEILDSDVILAYCPKPTVGTSMEVFLAWDSYKTVIVAAPFPASPWLVYHADAICETLDAALDCIVTRAWIGRT